MATIEEIKKLREETGAGVMDAKKALEDSNGNFDAAKEFLKQKGIERAAKKADREIKAGTVFSYVHAGRVGALVKIGCETDFVAKNEAFVKTGNEIAMHVAAMQPSSVEELLEQDYIRDSSKKVKDLITDLVSKTGENVILADVSYLAI